MPHARPRRLLPGILLAALPLLAHAGDPRVAELERRLAERDRVILELLERVEALERRVGVAPQGREPAGQPADTPAPPADQAPAPGTVVVEEDEAERALERSLTRAGALLLPRGVLEIEPGLTYTRREDRAPVLLASGGGLAAGRTERDADTLTADLALRLGLPGDAQLELGLPYRWREMDTVTRVGLAPTGADEDAGAGLGDLRVGLARTLLREGLWRPDLVARLTWDSATGARDDDGVALGGGFHELRASLSTIKRQDPVAFVGGLSYEHAFEDDGLRPGASLGATFGSFVALSPETSLRVALAAARQGEAELDGDNLDGSGRTFGTLVLGGTTLLAPGTLLNLSAGVGLTDDADDFSVSVSLPVRLDGRLY